MLGAMALVLVPLLAVPSLLVVAALELSTSSPVYWDATTCRFRRHKAYERRDSPPPSGPDFAARAGEYEPPALSEEEALTALAVQLSLDSAAEAGRGAHAAPTSVELRAVAPAAGADAQLAPAGARGEAAPAGGEGAADAADAAGVVPA